MITHPGVRTTLGKTGLGGLSRQTPINKQVSEDIDLLRRQVDVLQAESVKKAKPWYKDSSLTISLIALVASVFFSGQSLYDNYQKQKIDKEQRSEQEVKDKLEELNRTIAQIIELRAAYVSNPIMQGNNIPLRTQYSNLMNMQREILVDNANLMISEVPDSVSANVFLALGTEMYMDSEFEKAEKFYLDGLSKKDIPSNSKLTLKQSCAMLYFTRGANNYSPEKGRRMMEEVIQDISSRVDENAIQIRAANYNQRALFEFNNGFENYGNKFSDMAISEASKLSRANMMRTELITGFRNLKQFYTKAHSTAEKPLDSLLLAGRPTVWRVTYNKAGHMYGKLAISALPNQPWLTVTEDIYQNNRVIGKYTGKITYVKAAKMRIEWDGMRWENIGNPNHPRYQFGMRPDLSMPIPVTGVTYLHKIAHQSGFYGSRQVLGEKSSGVYLQRIKE